MSRGFVNKNLMAYSESIQSEPHFATEMQSRTSNVPSQGELLEC